MMAAFYVRACRLFRILGRELFQEGSFEVDSKGTDLESACVGSSSDFSRSLGFRFFSPEMKGAGDRPSRAQVHSELGFSFSLRGVFRPAGGTLMETPQGPVAGLECRGSSEGGGVAPRRGWRASEFREQVELQPLHPKHSVIP